jgi:hypothetical protein
MYIGLNSLNLTTTHNLNASVTIFYALYSKAFIGLVLATFGASIYALIQLMMEIYYF